VAAALMAICPSHVLLLPWGMMLFEGFFSNWATAGAKIMKQRKSH
jgi:hypothetical protein